MARITGEDGLDNVDNRFDRVRRATKRARQLSRGVDPLLPGENDKVTVVALREIAEGLVSHESVAEPVVEEESIDDELAAALAGELRASLPGDDA